MNRYLVALGAVSVVAAGAVLVDPPVNLQGSTPGTQQVGNANISGKLIAGTVSATSSGAGGQAIIGTASAASGLGYGGLFKCASPSGTGVRGYATATSGFAFGGDFQTDGPSGIAVRGTASSATGSNYGVYGKSNSPDGRGVYGIATATGGGGLNIGGEFVSDGPSGRGVRGIATSTSGSTYGGYFRTHSPEGRGVQAENSATSGLNYGGNFKAYSPQGRGLQGFALASNGSNFGVIGGTSSATNGYGLYSLGRTGASGTKSFRIDHPLDPENLYLNHYCSEGPEPLNVYSGTVRTDSSGVAWVQLPAYFEAINRDFRYQLTVVDDGDGAIFAQAKVARKIRENRFKIRTSVPNVDVCWEVKGVRNDLFVQRNGAPVEVEKEPHEQGLYQYPELYDFPKERGVFYEPGASKGPMEPPSRK